MKKCSKCNQLLNNNCFHKYKHDLQRYCKKCQKEYFQTSKGKKIKQQTHHKTRLTSQRILRDLKSNGCAICGYNKNPAALEFHHVNPENKRYSLSYKTMDYSDEKIVIEVNKCILLCANCHREIHHPKRGA